MLNSCGALAHSPPYALPALHSLDGGGLSCAHEMQSSGHCPSFHRLPLCWSLSYRMTGGMSVAVIDFTLPTLTMAVLSTRLFVLDFHFRNIDLAIIFSCSVRHWLVIWGRL